MKGMIFNIEKYALHDGEGIRTQVFFKGCPLRCRWCSNPEGLTRSKSIMLFNKLCIKCGHCINACENGALSFVNYEIYADRDKCQLCGKCEEVCWANAIKLIGYEASTDEIISEIEKDNVFYETSGGGVTFCGGEAMMQPEFLEILARELKQKGYNLAIETCGYFDFEQFKKVLPYLDFIYFDIKHTDETIHEEYTGKDNKLILENLQNLQEYNNNIEICIRVPIIRGINDSEKNIINLVNIIKNYDKIKFVEFLPYHRLGTSKYNRLNYEVHDFEPPLDDTLLKLKEIVTNGGIECIIAKSV